MRKKSLSSYMLFLEIGAALFCPYLTIYVIIDRFTHIKLDGKKLAN
jgi:hypothetical protein